MQNELLVAILAGLGSMLGWGVADFFAKKTIDKIGDVTTLFWGQFFGAISLLVLFLFNPEIPAKIHGIGFVYLIVLGIWSGLSYIPTYTAFGKGKVSLLSPIFASYAVVVTILSAIFFKEIIPFWREVSFVVVFLGILLINGNPKDLWLAIRKKEVKGREKIEGLKEIFLAIGVFSLWLVAFDRFLNGESWVPFLLGIRIFATLALFVYTRIKHISLAVHDKKIWKFLLCIGLFDVAAFAFLSLGFSKTSYLSVVTMLSGAFSLPTILLARIFLKEKVTRLQTLGSFIVVLGIMLLALF